MTQTGPEAMFAAYLAEGRFMLQYCRSNASFIFYPRVAAPGTGDRDIEWREASGEGNIYSVTTIRPKPPAMPYAVALIDLVEGPRMMSTVCGLAPEDIEIGMKVRAAIAERDGRHMVIFHPA